MSLPSSPTHPSTTPPHKIVEFQAVILAGGAGHRMYPLTDECPKSLLPVVNRPLIAFQLDLLESSGFTDALIITRSTILRSIQKYIDTEYKGTIKVNCIGVENTMGTADALRAARSHIKTDFFVLSGDLITNIQLHYLADIHRCRDASLTVLLQESAKEKDAKEESKKKEDDNLHSQYIGLLDTTSSTTQHSSPRLIYFKSANDVEDEFKLGKFLLKRHQSITLHTKLKDAHLYLFAHWILDLLDDPEHKDIQSIQSELIPFLVKHQYDHNVMKYRPTTKSHHQHLALSMSHGPSLSSSKDEVYRCYVYIASSTLYCQRANTVATYVQINRDLSSGTEHAYTPWRSIALDNQSDAAMKQFPKAMIGGSILSDNLKLADGCSIKKSIIGRGVKIGANAKINNSILMNGCNVEDGATITDSIICSNAIISRNVSLKDCRVGASFTVPASSEFKGETLCHEQK